MELVILSTAAECFLNQEKNIYFIILYFILYYEVLVHPAHTQHILVSSIIQEVTLPTVAVGVQCGKDTRNNKTQRN